MRYDAPVGKVVFEVYSRRDEEDPRVTIPWVLGRYATFEDAVKATGGRSDVWGIARHEVLA